MGASLDKATDKKQPYMCIYSCISTCICTNYMGIYIYIDIACGLCILPELSSHLPHADWSDFEYEAALANLEQAVQNAQKRGEYVLVGIDANAVIGKQEAHDSVRNALNQIPCSRKALITSGHTNLGMEATADR